MGDPTKIKGNAPVIIPDIEVFWNEAGSISVKQEPDGFYDADPSIVIVDRERAEALICALRHVLDSRPGGA